MQTIKKNRMRCLPAPPSPLLRYSDASTIGSSFVFLQSCISHPKMQTVFCVSLYQFMCISRYEFVDNFGHIQSQDRKRRSRAVTSSHFMSSASRVAFSVSEKFNSSIANKTKQIHANSMLNDIAGASCSKNSSEHRQRNCTL